MFFSPLELVMSMPSSANYADLAPLRREVPLAPFTTLGIGGPAEFFFEPQKPEQLADLLTALEADGTPFRMLGGGANTLFPDEGLRGAVVHTGGMRRLFRDEPGLRAWPGVTLPALVRSAMELGLSGVHQLVGVPGHVGGALAMNAGAADWGIWDQVEEVTYWVPGPREGLKIEAHAGADCQPRYRDGNLQGAVVLEVLLRLEESTKQVVKDAQDDLLRRKNQSQPVRLASAGCAFKNPANDSAGRLLDQAGMKGTRCGQAEVSPLHANFIVNLGGATAHDVRNLMEQMEAAVLAASGVQLERELQVVLGAF